MAALFISYSSHDREKAHSLADSLRCAGYTVWMDTSGIDAATSWSKEIARALEECSIVCVLLSESSLASHNVAKEVGVAAELGKHFLPIDLEPVKLRGEFLYHLANLQRVGADNVDAIARALSKLGVQAGATSTTQSPTPETRAPKPDPRTSLIITPFEDLSPAQDNLWFADGLAGELIDALAHIKSLRILDRKTSRDLRGVKQSMVELGKLFDTRYFIEGSVRKFGDQLKISVSLLDIETADYLWQESIKGVMGDIFEIQEKVAALTVEALKLHLTKEEDRLVNERGTANAEAYELFLKGSEYMRPVTREGLPFGLALLDRAIALDPQYADAYRMKALLLSELFRLYDRDPAHLTKAESFAKRALAIKPDLFSTYQALASIYQLMGRPADAFETANTFVSKDPLNPLAQFVLGFLYFESRDFARSIPYFEQAAKRMPENLAPLWNLVAAYGKVDDHDSQMRWARAALHVCEKRLQLVPDDQITRIYYATFLNRLAENDRAKEVLAPLLARTDLDPNTLYTIADLYQSMSDYPAALTYYRLAVEKHFALTSTIELLADYEWVRSDQKYLDEVNAIIALARKLSQAEPHARGSADNG